MPKDASTGGPSRRGRDGLGLFKSFVEFITSVTGFAAAGVGLLGTVAAFAIADVNAGTQDPPVPTPGPAVDVDRTSGGTTPARRRRRSPASTARNGCATRTLRAPRWPSPA